jgi:hypothetical protein
MSIAALDDQGSCSSTALSGRIDERRTKVSTGYVRGGLAQDVDEER